VLGAVAKGDDPLEGARVAGQAAKSDIVSKTQTIRIGHLPAAHTRIHVDGKIMIDLTWIAHRGFVYQIAGLASTKRFEALESTFAAVAQSLRPLSQAERSGIKEERIRLVKNLTKNGW
jgi:predicted Zn-dependent protease